jgi:hypothetical protein
MLSVVTCQLLFCNVRFCNGVRNGNFVSIATLVACCCATRFESSSTRSDFMTHSFKVATRALSYLLREPGASLKHQVNSTDSTYMRLTPFLFLSSLKSKTSTTRHGSSGRVLDLAETNYHNSSGPCATGGGYQERSTGVKRTASDTKQRSK